MERDLVTEYCPDTVHRLTFRYQGSDLLTEPGLVPGNGLLPDKGVFIRICLDLCAVNKDCLPGDLSHGKKTGGDLRQDIF